MAKGKYRRKRLRRKRRETMICESGISTRVVHLLEGAGIVTLRDLDLYSMDDLAAVPGIGDAAMKEIKEYRIESA